MRNPDCLVENILVPLLRGNSPIDTIDISQNSLHQGHLLDIFRALATNASVKHMAIWENVFAIPSILLYNLLEIIKENRTLISLNLKSSTVEADVPPALILALANNKDVGTRMYDIFTTHVLMPRYQECTEI
jgi:hypothetical protein